MWLYAPASLALVIKLALLFYGREKFLKNKQASTLFTLLLLLTVANVMEIFGLSHAGSPETAEIYLRIYYVSLVLLFVFLLQLSILVVSDRSSKIVEITNYLVGLIMVVLFLRTDFIVSGVASIGYSVTRVAGQYYWFFQTHAILMLLGSIVILIFGMRRARTKFQRIQSSYVLLGITFLAIPVLIAISMMAMGIKINASLILPVGVSLFLVTVVYAIKNHDLFDIRIWLPFTAMYKLRKAIFEEYQVAEDGDEWTAEERKQNHEKIYLLRLLIDHENNQSVVARLLGVSESTVSKKRKEYNI